MNSQCVGNEVGPQFIWTQYLHCFVPNTQKNTRLRFKPAGYWIAAVSPWRKRRATTTRVLWECVRSAFDSNKPMSRDIGSTLKPSTSTHTCVSLICERAWLHTPGFIRSLCQRSVGGLGRFSDLLVQVPASNRWLPTLRGASSNLCIPAICSLSNTVSSTLTVGGLLGSGKLVQINGSESSKNWTRHTIEAMASGHTGSEEAENGAVKKADSTEVPKERDSGTPSKCSVPGAMKPLSTWVWVSSCPFQNKRPFQCCDLKL